MTFNRTVFAACAWIVPPTMLYNNKLLPFYTSPKRGQVSSCWKAESDIQYDPYFTERGHVLWLFIWQVYKNAWGLRLHNTVLHGHCCMLLHFGHIITSSPFKQPCWNFDFLHLCGIFESDVHFFPVVFKGRISWEHSYLCFPEIINTEDGCGRCGHYKA